MKEFFRLQRKLFRIGFDIPNRTPEYKAAYELALLYFGVSRKHYPYWAVLENVCAYGEASTEIAEVFDSVYDLICEENDLGPYA